MNRTDLAFLVFGIGAFAEIIVLVLTVFGGVHSSALFYLLVVGTVVALGGFGGYLLEALAEENATGH